MECYEWSATSGVLRVECYEWSATSGVLRVGCYLLGVADGLHLQHTAGPRRRLQRGDVEQLGGRPRERARVPCLAVVTGAGRTRETQGVLQQ